MTVVREDEWRALIGSTPAHLWRSDPDYGRRFAVSACGMRRHCAYLDADTDPRPHCKRCEKKHARREVPS